MEPDELMSKLEAYYGTSLGITKRKNILEYQKLFDEVDQDEVDLLEQLGDNPFVQAGFLDGFGSTKAEPEKSQLFKVEYIEPNDLRFLLISMEKIKGGYEPYIIDIESLILKPLVTVTQRDINGWDSLVWLKEPTYKMLEKRFDEAIKARAEMQEYKEKMDRYVDRINKILEDGHDFLY